MNLINGTSVTVLRPKRSVDRLGNEVAEGWSEECVDNVLIALGPTSDMEASRPNGVTVVLTLHFPKAYEKSLEDCLVRLPAPWDDVYAVIGDPQPYMNSNVPGPWNRPVEVEVSHG